MIEAEGLDPCQQGVERRVVDEKREVLGEISPPRGSANWSSMPSSSVTTAKKPASWGSARPNRSVKKRADASLSTAATMA